MNFRILLAVATMAMLFVVPAVADHHEGGDHSHEMEMGPMGPPAELEKVSYLIGDWDVAVKVRMGPEAPWMEQAAANITKSILGGGALRSHFKGQMMGMDFEGYHTMTYDREEKRYEATWIDSMGCREQSTAGNFMGDKLVLVGTDLHMGEKMHSRMTTTKVSKDEFTWVMESSMDGENWYSSMEMTYTRKAGAR